jgi:nuclease HARBI1
MMNANFLLDIVDADQQAGEQGNYVIDGDFMPPVPVPPEDGVLIAAVARVPRLFRYRIGLLDVRDMDLIDRYRLPRHLIIDICELVRDGIERETDRSHAIPVHTQVLSVLRFFGCGTFQKESAEIVGFSQSSQSRILHSFLNAFLAFRNNFIVFPLDNPLWVARAKAKFALLAGFLNAFGLMDCVHVLIKTPPGDYNVHRNRKGRMSNNMQV